MRKITILAWMTAVAGLALAQAETTNDLKAAADTLVISATQPLSVKDKDLRQAVYNRCREMLDAPAGKFGAHPSADVFPGAVRKDAPRIAKTVSLKHTPPDDAMMQLIRPLDYSSPFAPILYSTGLYAAPGEVVTVEVPDEL